MKPKYEIGQEVYYHDRKTLVIGIKKGSSAVPFLYLIDEDDDLWISESILKLDNKKYYILYRSADGLEKREESQKEFPARLLVIDRTVMRASPCLRCNSPARNYRSYRYTETVLSHDGTNTTETYIYDEGI